MNKKSKTKNVSKPEERASFEQGIISFSYTRKFTRLRQVFSFSLDESQLFRLFIDSNSACTLLIGLPVKSFWLDRRTYALLADG